MPDYAAGHVPRSLATELRAAFASWLGWLLPDPRTPIIVLRNPDQDPDEVVWLARKIGSDAIAGELPAASARGRPAASRWPRTTWPRRVS